LSLYFTIEAQKLDRQYREVSIQPRVGLLGEVDDFSIVLANEGLGPAFIQRVTLGVAGKCYSSEVSTRADFSQAVDQFNIQVREEVYDKALPKISDKKKPLDVQMTMTPFHDGLTIRAGNKIAIFKLHNAVLKEIEKLDYRTITTAKIDFAKAVSQLSLAIEYCSATGLFCETIKTENETCPAY
jgi:hypothetical protein